MMHVLITGANGQLGNELKEIAPSFKNLVCHFYDLPECDITDTQNLEDIFSLHSPEYVINCAAYTAVDKAEEEPEKAFLVNQKGVANLVDLSEKYKAKLIHISTDYVFNGMNHRPYTEDNPVHPLSVYAKSKQAGEEEVIKYKQGMVIRTSWLYSTFGNNFVKTILRLAKDRDKMSIVFDQTGTPTYAGTLADFILDVIQKRFVPGIYHFSNEGIASWYDFAFEIISLLHIPCEVLPIRTESYPLPAKRPFYSVLDKTKVKNTYHYIIPHWKDDLKKCLTKLSI